MQTKIKHVFVVMFENRSFDHMLGFSAIQGTDARTGAATAIEGISHPGDHAVEFPRGSGKYLEPATGAPYSMPIDPPHEFKDTVLQLCGPGKNYADGTYPDINNSGFADAYHGCDPARPGENMKCFSPKDLPILHQLAREFAVCDHWFSSVPGPTWPNRFFLHAATSGGLDDSPTKAVIEHADLREEFQFQNGHIFNRLSEKQIHWVIYEGDELSQSFALSGMHEHNERGHLRPFKKFREDLNDPLFSASYIFIEPCYGYVLTDSGSFKCGNSQHPLDDARRGELLLKDIYETIRNSPVWESSCLLVTYDEHGGFYDHVAPPPAIPPGDALVDPSYRQNGFAFNRLGVRVPAVVISPWIPRNLIDHTIYDHTSLLKTLGLWLGLEPFTERDRHAQPFDHLFQLPAPRQDTPAKLEQLNYTGNLQCTKCFKFFKNLFFEFLLGQLKKLPISPTARGFLHLAFLKKIHTVPEAAKAAEVARYNRIDNKGDALVYMEKAKQQVKAHNDAVQPEKDARFAQKNAEAAQRAAGLSPG